MVLVGPPGAGKTTIGRRLARALNASFVDSDELIAQAHGKPCGEVFAELGEPAFRQEESRHVRAALETDGVVALGGGAVVTESTRDLLLRHTVVHIDVSPEEGVNRTAQAGNARPVLASANPLEHYRALVAERKEFYREVADFKARTDSRTPQQVVGDILGYLETL